MTDLNEKQMNIRNFSIIAHIDHGKSTLADRMLELTGTIPKRKMKEQVLDSMELERERGITIKMQPVRMLWHPESNDSGENEGQKFILNLIDTPGHIDFSYEVSRALKAVEGAILLVDSTQGIQAQTLTVLSMAKEESLVIVPVITKIDSPLARVEEIKTEIIKLLSCKEGEILLVSGKTGEGVRELLNEIVEKIPGPKFEKGSKHSKKDFQSVVFDFKYSTHRGVIVFVRVIEGSVSKSDELIFKAANKGFNSIEVGIFSPDEKPIESLSKGEIGYIVTGIKKPGIASVGDTVASKYNKKGSLSGYMKPKPVVWASVYPEDQNNFVLLRQALSELYLSDSSLSFEEEVSGALGKGFRCGFLGMLHLEIITERLHREFNLNLIVTTPSITYETTLKNGKSMKIYSPSFFPDEGEINKVIEPWVLFNVIVPESYLSGIIKLLYDREAEVLDTENFGDGRMNLSGRMPLREMMRNFFDNMKSVSSGFASISYEIEGQREAEVTRLDILIADEVVPAFSKVVAKRLIQEEAEKTVEKLQKIVPHQMFSFKIQAKGLGRIIASKSVSAMKKDVTGHLYGGDITRKMKLREKQKKGKKKMKNLGKVNIPHKVFVKMIRG